MAYCFLAILFFDNDNDVFHCKKKLTAFQSDGIIDSLKYEFEKQYLDYGVMKELLKPFEAI